jgi:hypothetical protein
MGAILRGLRAIGLLVILFASFAVAAETISASVKAGESKVVKEGTSPFYVKAKPKAGVAEVLAPETKGGNFRLRYAAPPSGAESADFTYTVGDDATENAVKVTITDAPPPSPAQLAMGTAAYAESFKALFVLFVLAVLLESALALIFTWRPFVENLVPRAVRPMIALAVALLFVWTFNLDIASGLINAVQNTTFAASPEGKILTAMIIAGGSSGVNTMLQTLGFRQVRTPETTTPKPPPNRAYISVRALAGTTPGPLSVYFGAQGTPALLGVIAGRSQTSFFSWMVPDRGRLPSYGGHTVADFTQTYELTVRAADGTTIVYSVPPFRLEAGSLIDFVFTASPVTPHA